MVLTTFTNSKGIHWPLALLRELPIQIINACNDQKIWECLIFQLAVIFPPCSVGFLFIQFSFSLPFALSHLSVLRVTSYAAWGPFQRVLAYAYIFRCFPLAVPTLLIVCEGRFFIHFEPSFLQGKKYGSNFISSFLGTIY